MPNALAFAKLYEPLLMEVYRQGVITGELESNALVSPMQSALANEVYVPKLSVDGLAPYDRATGYATGAVTQTWVPLTLTQDRGRKFTIDVVDNMESMKLAGANAMGEFVRGHVVPEVDAYRFSKWATGGDTNMRAYGAMSNGTALVQAIDTALQALDDASVPEDGKILFVTPAVYNKLKNAVWDKRMYNDSVSQIGKNVVMFDNLKVVKVPTSRFYTGITTGNNGYTNTGVAMDFMIVHPSAVFAVTKHTALKSADPDVDIDAMRFAYRLYHDAFVVPNHETGIYVHTATAIPSGSGTTTT